MYEFSPLSLAVLLDESKEKVRLFKGDMWSIHKFGGTCVGSSERIKNVAEIIINDGSEGKLVVVSAMSKVTDMMYDLIYKAQSRDDSYIAAADAVFEKHRLTAMDLLDGDDLASFLSRLHHDVNNLKAMLRAIYIGIKHLPLFAFLCVYSIIGWMVECGYLYRQAYVLMHKQGCNIIILFYF